MDFSWHLGICMDKLLNDLPSLVKNFHKGAVIRQGNNYQITMIIPFDSVIPTLL